MISFGGSDSFRGFMRKSNKGVFFIVLNSGCALKLCTRYGNLGVPMLESVPQAAGSPEKVNLLAQREIS